MLFNRIVKFILAIIFDLWHGLLNAIPYVDSIRSELETTRIQLAGCGVAAMGNTRDSVKERVQKGNPYWSASYDDVCRAVDAEIRYREDLERECMDIDNVIRHLGWEPETFRSEGGFLNVGKLKSALSDIVRPGTSS